MIQLATYKNNRYKLENGEERHRKYPDTFYIPKLVLRGNLQSNDIVKLIFKMQEKTDLNNIVVERMWVIIEKKIGNFYIGILDNDPLADVYLQCGDKIYFKSRHIIDIYEIDK